MSKVEDKRRKNLSRVFGELSGIKKRTSEEILEHFEYDMEKAFDYVHSNKGRIDIKSLKEERAPSQAVEIRNSKSNEEKKERRREDEGEQNTGDSDINIRKEMGGRPEIIISGPLEEGNEGEMSGSASENMSNMCELSPQSTCGVITFPRLDLSSLSFFPLGNILEKVFEGRREESLKPEVATPSKLSVSLPSPSLKWRGSLSAPLSPLAGPINIPIPHIDINTPHALNAPNNTPIISTRKPVIDHKDWTEHNSALSQITNWKEVPPWELKAIFQYEITQEGRKLEDDAICSICREDLYQNIYSDHTFHIMQSGASFHGYEVVLMKNCHYHFFHKTCLEQMALVTMGEGYIKCPICSSIYGLMTGDMPSGKMEIAFHQGIHCEGYIDSGVIQINYTFYDGLLPDSTPYHGTRRTAYLPDNQNGLEMLSLLKISFNRRLTFTVGTSVTTGRSNVVVWNGVHHKTALGGGAAYFGYPDPTYFNRLSLEMAAKGITLKDIPIKDINQHKGINKKRRTQVLKCKVKL